MIRGSSPRALAVVALALIVAGCGSSEPSPPPPTPPPTPTATPEPVKLLVFGAASLRGVLEQVESAYEIGHPGVDLIVSTDSSATLRTQIEQGAPADIFLSADTANPDALVDAGLVYGEPIPFARNRLTIIVPVADPGGIGDPADLARPGVKIVAAGDQVPITTYADQAVDDMATLPGYPDGFVAAYAANVVSREANVGAVVAKIRLREGDAAIVYATDAIGLDDVRTVEIPDAANPVATYAGVLMATSPHQPEAIAFFAWLVAQGRGIFINAGFLPGV